MVSKGNLSRVNFLNAFENVLDGPACKIYVPRECLKLCTSSGNLSTNSAKGIWKSMLSKKYWKSSITGNGPVTNFRNYLEYNIWNELIMQFRPNNAVPNEIIGPWDCFGHVRIEIPIVNGTYRIICNFTYMAKLCVSFFIGWIKMTRVLVWIINHGKFSLWVLLLFLN